MNAELPQFSGKLDEMRFDQNAEKLIRVVKCSQHDPRTEAEAMAWWRQHGQSELKRPELWASVSLQSIKKITSGGKPFPQARMAIVSHLSALYAVAYDTLRRPDDGRDPQVCSIVELHAPFFHDETLYRVRLLVKQFYPKSGRPAKMHSGRVEDVVLEKENVRLEKSDGDACAVPSSASPDSITLRQLFKGGKPFPVIDAGNRPPARGHGNSAECQPNIRRQKGENVAE